MRSSLVAMLDCLPRIERMRRGQLPDRCGLAAGARRARGRLDRARRRRIGNAAQGARARFQRRLAAHQFVELLLELLLIEQLAAGGAVDLGAQFGDAVLVGVLLRRLARDQRFETSSWKAK